MIGDGTQKGGVPYVCADYNYDPTNLDNYISAGFETNVTANGGWISNMGYGNEDLDWLYFPARTGLDSANSALPVGDYFWGVSGRFNGIRELAVGGRWDSKNEAGPFDYAFDIGYETPICGQNARAMFIPPKDATYEANVQKWKNKMGV